MSFGFFSGSFDLTLNFFEHINREVIGSFLMFLPFGVLHPLACKRTRYRKTILTGFICVIAIELLQPVFGRAFDTYDIIPNASGVFICASLFFAIRKIIAVIKKIIRFVKVL